MVLMRFSGCGLVQRNSRKPAAVPWDDFPVHPNDALVVEAGSSIARMFVPYVRDTRSADPSANVISYMPTSSPTSAGKIVACRKATVSADASISIDAVFGSGVEM